MEDSFSTLSSPTSHRTRHSPPDHLSPYFKRASGSYIEFEFLTSVDQRDGGLSRLVPLKLPPRLQIPPCPTPPRSRGGSAQRRAAGLRAAKNNKLEFDPFTAALERIRKEEQERVHESEMAGSTSPITTSRESEAKHRKGKSSVLLASAGRNHVEGESEENDIGDEIKLESSSSPSVFCYKPNLLACFILKK